MSEHWKLKHKMMVYLNHTSVMRNLVVVVSDEGKKIQIKVEGLEWNLADSCHKKKK